MNENNNQPPSVPFLRKVEHFQKMALFPALLIIMLIRGKVGYRIAKPNVIYSMTGILIGISLLFPPGNQKGVVLYALAFLIMGFFHRNTRWSGIRRGEERHTYATGDSYLELIPWPNFLSFLLDERRLYRFVEPMLVYVVAGLFWLIGIHALTLCLLVIGMALMVFEQGYYERLVDRMLDIYDAQLESKIQQQLIQNRGKQSRETRKILRNIGYPTGVAEDIQAKINALKERQA